MKFSALRRTSLYALSLGIAACGAGDRSAPSLPTSPQVARPTQVAVPEDDVSMPVGTEGAKPAGFEAVFRVKPKPDTEGVIHGESPLRVEFDECGSTTGGDKTLSYLYDWEFDHVANVVGTGDACHQEHTYHLKPVPNAKGDVLFETNVCVVSGNPRVHGPGTFFSCRTFKISLPVPRISCEHDLCTQGPALTASCDSCVAAICAIDSYCCGAKGGFWDALCVDEVSTICGQSSCQQP